MNFEIESKKQNLLQKRWEVIFKAEHKGQPTPKRDELRTKVAEAMNAKKEAVIIDHTNTDTGIGLSTGYAKVYENVEAIKKTEKHYILVRHGLAEKKVKVKKAKTAGAAKKKK